jgi:hypothetical protein
MERLSIPLQIIAVTIIRIVIHSKALIRLTLILQDDFNPDRSGIHAFF